MPAIVCKITGEVKEVEPLADGSPSLPRGWKRFNGDFYSPDGLHRTFVLRSVRLPVASVVQGSEGADWSQDNCRAGWRAFRKALRAATTEAARCFNAALTELAANDREPLEPAEKGPKLPKAPKVEALYALARSRFPELDSQSVGSILRRARKKFTETRFARRVLCKVTLPEQTKPCPIPIPEKDSRIEVRYEAGSETLNPQLFVRVRLQGEKFTLRLRKDRLTSRNHALLVRAGLGELIRGDLTLNEQVAHGRHSNGGTRRTGEGDNGKPTVVMAAVALQLPIRAGEREERTLVCRTQADKLWSVYVGDQEQPWDLNADHLKRLHVAHKARLYRLSQDNKFERRRPCPSRNQFASFREEICRGHRERLADFCHKAARMLVNFAVRRKCAAVEYDDKVKTWAPAFPWYKLRGLVKEKCMEAGLTFELVGGSDESDVGQALE